MKPSAYTPPPELTKFLEAGDPPVYIGFGSMKGNEVFCRKISAIAIGALKLAGQRGILLGGWAGLTSEVLDTSTEEGQALASFIS